MIDSERLVASLAAMGVLFAELTITMGKFGTLMSGKFKSTTKVSAVMLTLSTSVLILSAALKKMGSLDTDQLARGLAGIAGAMLILVKATQSLSSGNGIMLKGATGLIAMAAAVRILASAVAKIGGLDMATMAKGLAGVGVVLAELVLFSNGLGDGSKRYISMGIGMTALGSAMLIFAQAIKMMGSLDLVTIGKGLGTMAIALAKVTASMQFLPTGMVGKAAGMIGMATALVILSNALSSMGSMSLEQIAKGLGTMAVSLGILAVAMKAMAGGIAGSAALVIAAGAIAILAPALALLGAIPLENIGKALLAMVVSLGAFAAAGALLSPMIPALLGLTASLALFGAGVLAVGAGVWALSTGLTALSVAGASAVGALALLGTGLGQALIKFSEAIITGAPTISNAVRILVLELIATIADTVPQIVETATYLMLTLLSTLTQHTPAIIGAGLNIIANLLKGIRDNLPRLLDIAGDVVVKFIDGLETQMVKIIDAGFNFMINFILGLGNAVDEQGPRLIEAVVVLGGDILKGLIKGLLSGFGALGQAVLDIGRAIKDKFKSFFDIHSPSKVMRDEVGRYIVQGIAEGITKDTSAEDAAKKKAQNIINAFKTELDKISLDNTTLDLENQLWTKLNPNASTSETNSRAVELLNQKIKNQNSKIELAQGEYDNIVEHFGASSEEAQEAYNKLLQEKITLADLTNELNEQAQSLNDALDANNQAFRKYREWMSENKQNLLDWGFTLDQIESYAQKETGYDPTLAAPSNGFLDSFKDVGSNCADAVGEGIQNESPEVTDTAAEMVDTCAAEIGSRYDQFVKIGEMLATGLNKGLSSAMITTTLGSSLLAATIASSKSKSANAAVSGALSKVSSIDSLKKIGSAMGATSKATGGGIGISTAIGAIAAIASSRKSSQQSSSGGSSGKSFGTTYNFTQNNYSPKALSRMEIYRQTKNQFAALKGAMSK